MLIILDEILIRPVCLVEICAGVGLDKLRVL